MKLKIFTEVKKMNKTKLIILVVGLFLLAISLSAFACTSFIVGKKASVDGSTMITISQDQPVYDFRLEYIPAKDHKPGTMKTLYDYPQSFRWWDEYGNPIDAHAPELIAAEIPEVPHTYGYIRRMFGVMNEYQLSTGMATMSNMYLRNELWSQETKLRMTTLSYLAMERAKTAREAIKVIAKFAEEYGFKGERIAGKTLVIGDPSEVWVLHMIEPGPFWTPGCGELGCIWVAQRVPDDHVAIMPNGIQIGNIDFNDPDNFMYSSNIKSFAEEMGWYDPESGLPFDFIQVYTEGKPTGWSVSERQWRGYQLFAPSLKLPNPDEAYNMKDSYGWSYRYPFSVKAEKKISTADLMSYYRDHAEGTYLDLTKGPLAGPFGIPTRTFGSSFKVNEEKIHELRGLEGDGTTYTQVCQMRSWLPDPIGGIAWWSPGRPTTAFYVPFYCGINKLPDAYTTGNQFEMEWGKTAYWAATFVNTFSNVMYSYIIEDVKKKQSELEGEALAMIPVIDKIALDLYKSDPKKAQKYLTQWCGQHADNVVERYWDFANNLIIKYHNRYINQPKISTKPKIPDEDYWLNLALEYQKNVRKRIIK